MSSSPKSKAPSPRAKADAASGNPGALPQAIALRRVFIAFFRLGLSSFGGPIAHLAYFRTEFVDRRRWLGDAEFAELLALCQFLPGPASSQLGMAIGMRQAGFSGALAAWLGFTLPSALLMFALAMGLLHTSFEKSASVLNALLLVSVAVVAQALTAMAKSLCPDSLRGWIAVLSCSLCLLMQSSLAQLLAIGLAAFAGSMLIRPAGEQAKSGLQNPSTWDANRPGKSFGSSEPLSLFCLVLFFALLLGLPLLNVYVDDAWIKLIDSFYRAGALVFGGGQVVLPLLQTMLVPESLQLESFLAAYAAAQAMPGPLFTVAAFLGAVMPDLTPSWLGALMALTSIFLPGFLLVIGVMPLWSRLIGYPLATSMLAGVNAAVVGFLLASLYDPIFVHAVRKPLHFALALLAYALLVLPRLSPLWIVLLGVLAGLLLDL